MNLGKYEADAGVAPPSAPASPSTGYCSDGNPGTGVLATLIGPYWFYQVQAEMAAVLAAAGITPDHTDLGQLADAIRALTAVALPAGKLGYFLRSSAPDGWHAADGTAIPRATDARLDAAIYVGDSANETAECGYRCTDADGTGRSTTGAYLVLPEMRAEIARGLDAGRGVDTDRELGSAQADAFRSHTHSLHVDPGYGGENAVSASDGGWIGGVTATLATGGAETRMRNVAWLACISR